MNDSKYGRLYPERAVAQIKTAVEAMLMNENVPLPDLQKALLSLEYDGFPSDEPLFLLRGQDVLAGEMVHTYAQIVRDHPQPSVRALDADRIDEHADRMDNWMPRKYPD